MIAENQKKPQSKNILFFIVQIFVSSAGLNFGKSINYEIVSPTRESTTIFSISGLCTFGPDVVVNSLFFNNNKSSIKVNVTYTIDWLLILSKLVFLG